MTKVKKILYLITQSELGGAQRYIFDLAKNLKNGYEISVAFGEQGEKGGMAEALKNLNIPCFSLPHLRREISPVNDLMAASEIRKLIAKIHPDIIHLNSSKISILGSLAAIGKKSRVIYTAHGWVFNEPLSPWKKTFYRLAEKLTARLKDKIICVSEFDRQIALKEKIAPEEKLLTIHNGIAPVDFLTKEEARKILNLNTNSLIIGSIGNLYKTKGFEYFIEAAHLVTAEFPKLPLKFIIIGEGGERKKLEALIKKHNLKERFTLAGSISEAGKLLKAFDIYVCSSVKEGLSYTLLEASQAGLPIVATEVGGNSEIIKNMETGIIVEPKSAASLSEKIIKLINNKELSLKLADCAKKNARDFQSGQMINKVKSLYSIY